jgi:hypothetical protein
MSKQTQKEAVFQAVTNVITEIGGSLEGDVSTIMTRELRAQVNQILFEGFRNGTVELAKEFSDTDLKAYVSGLQSNWIRKDKRLNGGVGYVAKNPGSRIGSSDPQLKNMKALLSTLEAGTVDFLEVEAHIASRAKELQVSKVKAKVIDFSTLPIELARFSK